MTSLTKKNKYSNPKLKQFPVGEINGVNLDYILPNGDEFWPGTLEVIVDGSEMCPSTFTENGTTGFTVIVDPTNPNARNKPFRQSETVWIRYYRKPKCK